MTRLRVTLQNCAGHLLYFTFHKLNRFNKQYATPRVCPYGVVSYTILHSIIIHSIGVHMTKKQIINIRWQTWSAFTAAFNSGVPYSRWSKESYDSYSIIPKYLTEKA